MYGENGDYYVIQNGILLYIMCYVIGNIPSITLSNDVILASKKLINLPRCISQSKMRPIIT